MAEPTFIRRILLHYAIATTFVLIVALLWFASSILLLIFGAILIAVLLSSATARLQQWFRVWRGVALAMVLLLAVSVIGGGGWLLAPHVAGQGEQLVKSLPEAVDRLREYLQQFPLLQAATENLPAFEEMVEGVPDMLTRARSVFTGVFGVFVNIVIVLFLSVYLAAQPQVYINGFVTLFPKTRRARICEVVYRIGDTLGLWLMGKMLSMVIVGTVTAVSLMLLDVPLALVLGVVAGLFEFIPYLGPVMAGIPAVLIAFSQSPSLALSVLMLFAVIQMAEGYFLQPMIERRTVSLPPAMTISTQVMMALPFGLLGVALATPLVASIVVVVSMLYVQDVLDDPVTPPGGD
jgi:predicted PurR-regulated permease PerM